MSKQRRFLAVSAILLASALALLCHQILSTKPSPESEQENASEAGASLNFWAMARTFPDGKFHTEQYAAAYAQARLQAQMRGGNNPWESLGPKNIGGRTLCLAIHPQDTNVIFAGSASGGLWKTTTAGRGYHAWQYVETGFPVLGVSAIAINPENPNEMYIGTGEVYNVENSMPNVAIRVTRGIYGIGILKSLDGGSTWHKSLDWAYGDLRGVQDIKLNPLRPATVYAATSEGLLRSYNSGATWQTVHNKRMAVDIELHPTDTTRIFVTHGSLDDEDVSGIYRSSNAGASFQKLANGLPDTYSGKTLLSICQSQPDVIYASVSNNYIQDGMYRSDNGGTDWTQVSTQNVAAIQGWYAHDVAVHPNDPDDAVWGGQLSAFKTTDGGISWSQQSIWSAWYFGQVPVGGPEGPSNYVHADIHRIYHLTSDPNKIYYATDGGIFVSYDGGLTFEGRNGDYQTTQFYANFSNSSTNPIFAIGGMQDNGTAIYTGDDAWTRRIGGDGECTAIDPTDDQIMYGSSQYLNMYSSNDGGQNFYYSSPPEDGAPCFNGPFELAPSQPSTIYAGGPNLWRSDDGAQTWENAYGGWVNDGNGILTIAVGTNDPNLLYFSTAPTQSNNINVYKSTDGGQNITLLEGLPNRMCMDIAIHPVDNNIVYAVFSGFAAGHVWKSTDGGSTWGAIDNGLPDVPTNTILIDPLRPDDLYIGNDLGVWFSDNAGNSWEIFSADAPGSLLVMHLSVSPANRKLRVATFGLGVWQTDMDHIPSETDEPSPLADAISLKIAPNPMVSQGNITISMPASAQASIRLFDINGKEIKRQGFGKGIQLHAASQQIPFAVNGLAAGMYGVMVEGQFEKSRQTFKKSVVLTKI